jgi:hypothetical protein
MSITKLDNNYSVWKHNVKNDWSINGYKCIYNFDDGVQFWQLFNNWNNLGTIFDKPLFIMKNNIQPIWEDENNKNGGCWSFKVFNNNAEELWEELATFFITNNILVNKNDEINGISITVKKNNYSVIKIWNKNNTQNSINNLNKIILAKWGTDIIYISHNG